MYKYLLFTLNCVSKFIKQPLEEKYEVEVNKKGIKKELPPSILCYNRDLKEISVNENIPVKNINVTPIITSKFFLNKFLKNNKKNSTNDTNIIYRNTFASNDAGTGTINNMVYYNIPF